jgi:DNA-binding NtrC family response regulator
MAERTLLIVDEQLTTLTDLAATVKMAGPYRVLTESNPARVLERLERDAVDLILCDLNLSQASALELLDYVKMSARPVPVVVYADETTNEYLPAAIQRGAASFVTDPFNPQLLSAALQTGLNNVKLVGEVEKLKRRLGGDHKLGGLIGRSIAMHRVFDVIRDVCEVDTTVLIRGETGTGKELVARALHFEGPRANKPFVKVNCAALPETLLESELFGHEKGAFTDARQQRIGKFEVADGGTIFLDEIGDISLSTQVKLLNVLQDREIERLGSNKRISVNIRVITATNKDLERLIQEGRFRLDLYYRLNVVPVTVGPLRERKEDIPLLCSHFIEKIGSRLNRGLFSVTDDALMLLMNHNWPGNIRELENVIERSILATTGTVIGHEALNFLNPMLSSSHPSDLLASVTNKVSFPGPYNQPKADSGELITPGPLKAAVKNFEKLFILNALQASGGHVIRAARVLKIDRTTLWKKARDLGINMHSEEEETV